MFSYKSLFAAFFALVSVAAYQGDGTFYGAGGNGARGACMLQPGHNGVQVTVAMNAAQYQGSCGKCLKITGEGQGGGRNPIIGPIYATVDNLCPECKYGDVDLGLSGDGRWRINWEYIDCEEARQKQGESKLPGPNGPAPGTRGNSCGWWGLFGCRRNLRGSKEEGN